MCLMCQKVLVPLQCQGLSSVFAMRTCDHAHWFPDRKLADFQWAAKFIFLFSLHPASASWSQKLWPHDFDIMVFVRPWRGRHPESTWPHQFILTLFLMSNCYCLFIIRWWHKYFIFFCLHFTIFYWFVNLHPKLKTSASSKEN